MGLDSAGWQGPGWPGDLPPRDAACSSRRRPAPFPGAGARPGRARSRCPAGSSAPRRCRRPGRARCWCTGTPPWAGPAATRVVPAGARRPRRCWCPRAGAASAAARAWGTRRCGCPRTCRNLPETREREGRKGRGLTPGKPRDNKPPRPGEPPAREVTPRGRRGHWEQGERWTRRSPLEFTVPKPAWYRVETPRALHKPPEPSSSLRMASSSPRNRRDSWRLLLPASAPLPSLFSFSPSSLLSLCVVFRGVFIIVPGGKCLSTHLESRRDSTLVESWLCLVFLSLRRDFQNHQSRRATLPATPGSSIHALLPREGPCEGRSRPWPRGAAVPHPSHRGRPGAVSPALLEPVGDKGGCSGGFGVPCACVQALLQSPPPEKKTNSKCNDQNNGSLMMKIKFPWRGPQIPPRRLIPRLNAIFFSYVIN